MTKSKEPTKADLQKQVKTLTAKVTRLTKQLATATAYAETARKELENFVLGNDTASLAETLNVAQPKPMCYVDEEPALPNPFEVDSLRMPWDK